MAEGGWRRRILPRGRTPLLITLVIVGVIVGIYWAYYRSQVAYYTGRNLRILATLTAQVDDRIEQYARFVATREETGEEIPLPVTPCVAVTPVDPNKPTTRRLHETERGWAIAFQGTGGALGLQNISGAPSQPAEQQRIATPNAVCALVTLDDVVRPVVSRKAASAFDLFIVADTSGRVLYTIRPPAPSYTVLRTEHGHRGPNVDRTAQDQKLESPLTINDLSALASRAGWRKYEPLKIDELTRGTRHSSVMIDGVDYLAFSQPHTFATAATSTTNKQQQWIVAGLVTASRFRYDAWAVSTSTILLAVGLVLIGICCWPYLRIAFINDIEELTITDVVLIVLCTITGVAIVVLLVLDTLAYRRVSASLDDQLHNFGTRIDDDFQRDVGRAAAMLKALEERTRNSWPDDAGMLELLKSEPAVQAYPYIRSFSWIRGDGVQYFKYSAPSENAAGWGNPRVRVAERRYFRDALEGRSWKIDGNDYVLEWVRSFATGEMTAVLARKTEGAPAFPVITVGTELINLSAAIHPPGVEFAIIDDDGAVLFHSDQQRIGYENFFAETDWDRDLRAAVVSRREATVNAQYWGEDQRMFVRPLSSSPWTLVTFGAKRLPRVLNLEAVLLTLLLLILSATPYFLIYMTVLFLRPWYRAPALWPDPLRRGEYARLVGIYVLALILYALCIYALTPWSYFAIAFAIPAQTIVATYLVLHRRDPRRHRFHVAMVIWLAIWAVLLVSLFRARVDAGLIVSMSPTATKTALMVLALITMAVVAAFSVARTTLSQVLRPDRDADADLPLPRRDLPQRMATPFISLLIRLLTTVRRAARNVGLAFVPARTQKSIHYGTLYRLCGVMLLIVGVVVPVVAFFRISSSVEMELLVKYTQLRASADLEHRMHHLEELNLLGDAAKASVAEDMRDYRLSDIFTGSWELVPREHVSDCDALSLAPPTLPRDVARWLPAVYDDSIAIRQLYDSASADDLWKWCRDGRQLKLDRMIRLEPKTALLLFDGKAEERQTLRVRSELRHLLSWKPGEWLKEQLGDTSTEDDAAGIGMFALLLVLIGALLAMLWFIANFIATRVLLIDVNEPLWLAKLPLSPTLGDHLFLIRRSLGVDALTGKGTKAEFYDVHFKELSASNSWDEAMKAVDAAPPGRNVRIQDFEYGIHDGAINEKKLDWIERLLKLPDRTVIIVSAVSPPFILTTPPPKPDAADAYFDRWQRLLRGFVWVTEEQLELRKAEYRRSAARQPWAQPRSFLAEETAYNPFLSRLAGELDPNAERRQLLDEITERADTYYAGLWASCTDDEKLLLYHLAHNGLVNAKNRRLLRRLIARGLVRRDPNLELFSETFRLYVLSAARREEIVIRAKAAAPASTWSSLRLPLFVVLLTFLALLFGTQKDLLTATTAVMTAVTTGLPVIVKLFGMITERRLEQAERT